MVFLLLVDDNIVFCFSFCILYYNMDILVILFWFCSSNLHSNIYLRCESVYIHARNLLVVCICLYRKNMHTFVTNVIIPAAYDLGIFLDMLHGNGYIHVVYQFLNYMRLDTFVFARTRSVYGRFYSVSVYGWFSLLLLIAFWC